MVNEVFIKYIKYFVNMMKTERKYIFLMNSDLILKGIKNFLKNGALREHLSTNHRMALII